MITALVIFLLIFLNALFVAAEFTLIGVPRSSMEKKAKKGGFGSKSAARVVKILRTPQLQDRYIATAQLGITFASLGLGMYGEHSLAVWLYGLMETWGWTSWITAHGLASALAVAFLTYVHIVLGEMVPKSLALMHAKKLALIITLPMLWVKTIMYPLVVGLNSLGNFLLKLVGVQRSLNSGYYHSPEEILYIIQESSNKGMLKGKPAKLMQDLFDFHELLVHEAMTPRVRIEGIPYGATDDVIRDIVSKTGKTRYPVYKGDLDHVAGMVHAWDLFQLMRSGSTLTDAVIHPVPFVPKTLKLDDAMEAMKEFNSRIAIVMDEHGGTMGLITMEDIFSEVVGETNNNPVRKTELQMRPNGTCIAEGTARLDELGELFHRGLEYESVDSVSGLILALLQRPPRIKDTVTYRGLSFEVLRIKNKGVQKSLVTQIAEPPENESD